MNKTRDRIIRDIIRTEGGYVSDPSDSGGETNFGITKKTAVKYSYVGKIQNLPIRVAIQIYQDNYWDKLRLEYIASFSVKLAEELMDTGVNQGVGAAARYLQRALNVLNNREEHYLDIAVDGVIGHGTLTAFNSFVRLRSGNGCDVLFRMLNCMQGAFYIELAERREKDERFIYGWFLNRVK